MKDIYTNILKEIFSKHVIFTRKQVFNISQEKMAANLMISQNNYSNLETQKSYCSGLTLAIYLANYCEDTEAFITDMRSAFKNIEIDGAALK